MEGLPASCISHCGLCGNTLVVMGASVSMQISVCFPSVCMAHVKSSARVWLFCTFSLAQSGGQKAREHAKV